MIRRDVFQAIADPTRRAIIHLVAHDALNLNTVASKFNISRPAISRHIKILAECGLIVIRQKGRERFCEADLTKLRQVAKWIALYKEFWTGRLDALALHLDKEHTSASKRKQ